VKKLSSKEVQPLRGWYVLFCVLPQIASGVIEIKAFQALEKSHRRNLWKKPLAH